MKKRASVDLAMALNVGKILRKKRERAAELLTKVSPRRITFVCPGKIAERLLHRVNTEKKTLTWVIVEDLEKAEGILSEYDLGRMSGRPLNESKQ